MDTRLITSPGSSTPFPVEMIAIEQSWSSGCYYSCSGQSNRENSFLSSSPSTLQLVNGTTKRKLQNSSPLSPSSSSSSSNEPLPLCSIIVSLLMLNVVIILHDFYSSFHCIVSIFNSFLGIVSCIWNAWAAKGRPKRPIEKCCTLIKPDDVVDDGNVSLTELMKGVIEGSSYVDHDKMGGLFEEEEPSLMEVKEAFDVFDENKDGFIDARELKNVLSSLGFMDASEEDCKRMIKAFDCNFDGRIDLGEFVKVMERSLC